MTSPGGRAYVRLLVGDATVSIEGRIVAGDDETAVIVIPAEAEVALAVPFLVEGIRVQALKVESRVVMSRPPAEHTAAPWAAPAGVVREYYRIVAEDALQLSSAEEPTAAQVQAHARPPERATASAVRVAAPGGPQSIPGALASSGADTAALAEALATVQGRMPNPQESEMPRSASAWIAKKRKAVAVKKEPREHEEKIENESELRPAPKDPAAEEAQKLQAFEVCSQCKKCQWTSQGTKGCKECLRKFWCKFRLTKPALTRQRQLVAQGSCRPN